jgi:glycosyltransferase involved in cell wall biosynthesis
MSFADHYLAKQQTSVYIPFEKPSRNLKYVVVIPCYNEDTLTVTLDSLWNCQRPASGVEVVVVVNSSETDIREVIDQNLKTIDEFENWKVTHNDPAIRFHLIHVQGIPKKHAGAGLARKTGMDYAVFRFNSISRQDGVIISLDADCTCEKNYFTEIESTYAKSNKTDCAILYFEHPVAGGDFPSGIYSGIAQYELHLRYHIAFLRYIKYPYAFHTLGSCFAVKAETYVRQGGMNRKNAGEDFYFLQKIFTACNITEINSTSVYPSPRPSLRVAFGTGPVIHKMYSANNPVLKTYAPQAYIDLGKFLEMIPQLFRIRNDSWQCIFPELPDAIREFLIAANVDNKLGEINKNTGNQRSFIKRFYDWFNGFMVVKYLNNSHQRHYNRIPVEKAAKVFLQNSGLNAEGERGVAGLLKIFREIQRGQNYTISL